jgi:nucleoside-diphosphate-sugar epimerase
VRVLVTAGDGFAGASTASLLLTRGRLLEGLERVAESLHDGSFHAVGPKGEAPPSQSGQLTLGLLVRCDEELAYRVDRSQT